MQQHRHQAEFIKPRSGRTDQEKQMLADVWQQNMDDDVTIIDEHEDDDDDDDVRIVEPDGHALPFRSGVTIPPAVLPPVEEEEEAPAAGDTFMVSSHIKMSPSKCRQIFLVSAEAAGSVCTPHRFCSPTLSSRPVRIWATLREE